MNYRLNVIVTPFDIFKMTMKKIYRSPIGIINIVFCAALVAATIRLFGNAGPVLRSILVILCLAFPVLQPLAMYIRSSGIARSVPEDLTIETCDHGLLVRTGGASELIGYKRIGRIVSDSDCVILFVGGRNGYFLFNRVLGDRKKDFTEFIKSKMV